MSESKTKIKHFLFAILIDTTKGTFIWKSREADIAIYIMNNAL